MCFGQDDIVFDNLRADQGVEFVEYQEFHGRAVVVFNGNNGPGRAVFFAESPVNGGDDSADDYFGTMFKFAAENGGEFGVGLRSNGFFVSVKRVPGYIESEHFTFECEFVFAFPFFIGDLHGKEVVYSPAIPAAVAKSGKEVELPFIGGFFGGDYGVHGVFVDER